MGRELCQGSLLEEVLPNFFIWKMNSVNQVSGGIGAFQQRECELQWFTAEMAVGDLALSRNWKKAGVDGARETMVRGQAEVKAPGAMTTRRSWSWPYEKLLSDINRSVFWKDHSDHSMKTRLERVRMDKGRTDELEWTTFMKS